MKQTGPSRMKRTPHHFRRRYIRPHNSRATATTEDLRWGHGGDVHPGNHQEDTVFNSPWCN